MRSPAGLLSFALLLGCGASSSSVAPAPSSSAVPTDPVAAKPAALRPPPRDPKIMVLARAAAACPMVDGYFDETCPAYVAWIDADEPFAEGRGNDTILSLIDDDDSKLRTLAAARGLDNGKAYLAHAERAKRVMTIAARRIDDATAGTFGTWVAGIDAEAYGLGDQLRKLAKHPNKGFRKSLAFYVLGRHQTPVALEVVRALIDDTDKDVRTSAIGSLSTGGITPATQEVCALTREQIQRSDAHAGDALWAGSSSQCPNIDEAVLTALGARVTDPTQVTNTNGVRYSLAASAVCTRSKSPDTRAKAYDLLKVLTDPAVPDVNTRNAAMGSLPACDPARAPKDLQRLSRDRDRAVAKHAAELLTKLKK